MTDAEEAKLKSLKELMEKELPKQEWVIEGLIPKNKLILAGGARRSYKSWVALLWLFHISTGRPFLGRKVEKCNCLYLDGENSEEEDQRRLKYISHGEQLPEESKILCYPDIRLDEPSHIVKLGEIIKKYNIKVIFVDTIRRFFKGEENDALVMNDLLNERIKKELIEKCGVTVILFHHIKKVPDNVDEIDPMDLLRGSSELANIPDGIFMITREGKREIAVLRVPKTKYGREPPDIIMKFTFNDWNQKLEVSATDIASLEVNKYGEVTQKLHEWICGLKVDIFATKDAKDFFNSIGMNVDDERLNEALKRLKTWDVITHFKHGYWKKVNQKLMF
jgi:RecA-family ATPase